MSSPLPSFALLFATLLTAAAANDLKTGRLPDSINSAIFVAGIAFAAWVDGVNGFVSGLAAAVAGGGAFCLVAAWYRQTRGRDGLGGGDTKLVAACGPWLGLTGLAPMILIAAISGILFACAGALGGRPPTRSTILPFGPFLASAAFLVWLSGVAGWSA